MTDSRDLPIVDTHQHLWDLDLFRPPWLTNAPPVLAQTRVPDDYLKATESLNVVQTVYMEVDVAVEDKGREAEYVIGLCESPDQLTKAAVISGRPEQDGFEAHVDRFKDSPYVKGLRRILHEDDVPTGRCLEPQFLRNVQYLGEIGLSFDVCIRPSELDDAVELVDQCPDTRFILDHCGNADPKAFLSSARVGDDAPWHEVEPWKRGISELARRENTICKISGLVARAPANDWSSEDLASPINHCLDEFGPDRVVFGGDWPVLNLTASFSRWVAALKEVVSGRPEEEQRKLFCANAVRFYALRSDVMDTK